MYFTVHCNVHYLLQSVNKCGLDPQQALTPFLGSGHLANWILYNGYCTFYTVHCTLYTIYITLYTVHCIGYCKAANTWEDRNSLGLMECLTRRVECQAWARLQSGPSLVNHRLESRPLTDHRPRSLGLDIDLTQNLA